MHARENRVNVSPDVSVSESFLHQHNPFIQDRNNLFTSSRGTSLNRTPGNYPAATRGQSITDCSSYFHWSNSQVQVRSRQTIQQMMVCWVESRLCWIILLLLFHLQNNIMFPTFKISRPKIQKGSQNGSTETSNEMLHSCINALKNNQQFVTGMLFRSLNHQK